MTAPLAGPLDEAEKLDATKRLKLAGVVMANILFNLKQRTSYGTEHMRRQMDEAQTEWDAALFALASPLPAEAAVAAPPAIQAVKALEPLAWIGQWLFARDLPDDTPMVSIEGGGKPFTLTRGMFKAAHTAFAALSQAPGSKEGRS